MSVTKKNIMKTNFFFFKFMLSRGREKANYDDDMEEEPFDFRRISV